MATAADTKDDTAATGSAAENMDFLEGEDYSSIADPLALVSPDGAQYQVTINLWCCKYLGLFNLRETFRVVPSSR